MANVSMARWLCAVGVLGGLLTATPLQAQQNDNLVEVTVAGIGLTREEAVNDALRKAVEEGAGAFISSQSDMQDFMLVRDTVLVRSAGFVHSREVLEAVEDPIEGSWEVTVKVVVSIQGVEDTWAVVKNLLDQMGRPVVMVAITETIDGQAQADSTVQTRIEGLLLESGFRLVNKEQLSEIERRDIEAAVLENKPEVIQAIAQRFGAQVFITGSTAAARGSGAPAYGVDLKRYGADGDLKCYRSDTAELLSSRNGRTFGVDRTVRLAAKKAVEQLGDEVAPIILRDILGFWQDALQGRGAAKLIVEGVDYDQAMDIEDALAEIEDITSVDTSFNEPLVEYQLESAIPAERLARIIRQEVDGLRITSVSQNVIKATVEDD